MNRLADWVAGLCLLAYLYAVGVLLGWMAAHARQWIACLERLPR